MSFQYDRKLGYNYFSVLVLITINIGYYHKAKMLSDRCVAEEITSHYPFPSIILFVAIHVLPAISGLGFIFIQFSKKHNVLKVLRIFLKILP